ncbi:MAG: bifunctional phosphoribosylaminoimidazolecarboxamide formyltransferase/IMP cyclohydrolase PurH [Candidatus Dadabacteria bacterium]|nr:MAG: bifunctional phosphoribosylaminoimidazolecarboxamide formyltransferase/IMP cyclohydrolase PurH [Candidatus Dadabacteria bacterium]
MESKKAALISVYEKEGLEDLAKALHKAGYIILASGGTARKIEASGVAVTRVSDYTGQSEILDGRVKTLHPKIYAGILSNRSIAEHQREIEENFILPIDVVVINFYPFKEKLSEGLSLSEMLEYIDIGGPAALRAAAKNFPSVWAVSSPSQYSVLKEVLLSDSQSFKEEELLALRREFAREAFKRTSIYDGEIFNFLMGKGKETSFSYPFFLSFQGEEEKVRYGENPHQRAAFLKSGNKSWRKLQGKELSYNNLLDLDAASEVLRNLVDIVSFSGVKSSTFIFKHLTPCGAAFSDKSLLDSLLKAKSSDTKSHFGGIFVLFDSKKGEEEGKGSILPINGETAEEVIKDFAELVVAFSYTDEALEVFKRKKNLRVIEWQGEFSGIEYRSIQGGCLVQERDSILVDEINQAGLTEGERQDLLLALLCARLAKSNTVCLASGGKILGVGAGQTSRVDSAEVAVWKAGLYKHNLSGAVAVSDGFFPFPDSLEILSKAGVKTVAAPLGSKNDDVVLQRARELGVKFIKLSRRHFRH